MSYRSWTTEHIIITEKWPFSHKTINIFIFSSFFCILKNLWRNFAMCVWTLISFRHKLYIYTLSMLGPGKWVHCQKILFLISFWLIGTYMSRCVKFAPLLIKNKIYAFLPKYQMSHLLSCFNAFILTLLRFFCNVPFGELYIRGYSKGGKVQLLQGFQLWVLSDCLNTFVRLST